MVQAPQSAMAESVRELRTSLRVILDETRARSSFITSPEPGDGKTFVHCQSGRAWAMSGRKVIVVSADFRRPRLEEIFGLQVSRAPGLADLIRANGRSRRSMTGRRFPGTTGKHRNKAVDRRVPPILRNSSCAERRWNPKGRRPAIGSLSSGWRTGIWGLQLLPAGNSLGTSQRAVRGPGNAAGARPTPACRRHRPFGYPTHSSRAGYAIMGVGLETPVLVASEVEQIAATSSELCVDSTPTTVTSWG